MTTTDLPAELRRRPWLRGRSRPLRQTMVIDRVPRVQIAIFDDCIYLTRRQGQGWVTYPIRSEDLAEAVGNLPTVSGLLPPNVLGTGTVHGYRFYVQYVAPRKAALHVVGQLRPCVIQTPPLIWAGCGQDYRVFALNTLERPEARSLLYHAPFSNTYDQGGICWGSTDPRGDAGPATMEAALGLYLEGSFFNSHFGQQRSRRKPRSVMALYRSLSADTPYPLDDLMPAAYNLEWLLTGRAWQEGRR
jgi:PRTRC genetic system protein B